MKLKKARVKRGSWYTVSIPFTPHDRVVVGEAIQESGMGVGEFFRAAALAYRGSRRKG